MQDRVGLVLPTDTFHELRGREIFVGRAGDNDVVVANAGVSRRHARLREEGGRWFLDDRGSLFGTFLNGVRLQPGVPYPLRHGDRIAIGEDTLVFFHPGNLDDPDETGRFEVSTLGSTAALSPFQRQVVAILCSRWVRGGTLEDLPSNDEIAAELGTPDATESVKAALRRIYSKAGLSSESSSAKRRKLCIVARRRGWI